MTQPTIAPIPHLAQAMALHQAGNIAQAAILYQQIIDHDPLQADAIHLLGLTFHQTGQPVMAAELIRKALDIAPTAHMHFNMSLTEAALGDHDAAISSLKKALSLNPHYAEAHYNLGISMAERGQLDDAAQCYRNAIAASPQYTEAHVNLGITLFTQGKLAEAIECYLTVLKTQPDNLQAHNNLGNAYLSQNRQEEAVECFQKALRLDLACVEAWGNLGKALQTQGRLKEAIATYSRAIVFSHPQQSPIHSNLIFAMDMLPDSSVQDLQQERALWARRYADGLTPHAPFHNTPDGARKLRIGYVSGDFKYHSAVTVFLGMLTHFDPQQFEVYAYNNAPTHDAITALIEARVTHCRTIAHMEDASIAQLIREDEIDILVDLSGHSAFNRLLVFARKPAPIQITAWGYIGGTGMKAMDVFFADDIVVPPEEQHLYTEKVVYLPSVVSYYPLEAFPSVNALPALSGRGVTFGSFNRLIKITEESFQLWGKVLQAVPNSRMILKTAELDDPATKKMVSEKFAQAGVAPERIIFQGKTSWAEHMAAFNQVDIALDPFPHGGGVTTLEGVMMGVPVVTLCWPTLIGRLSASLITPIGLTDWIAETTEQYLSIAVEKASNPMALAILRKQLRNKMTQSPTGNPKGYTQAVEKIYRQLWQEWCASQ